MERAVLNAAWCSASRPLADNLTVLRADIPVAAEKGILDQSRLERRYIPRGSMRISNEIVG